MGSREAGDGDISLMPLHTRCCSSGCTVWVRWANTEGEGDVGRVELAPPKAQHNTTQHKIVADVDCLCLPWCQGSLVDSQIGWRTQIGRQLKQPPRYLNLSQLCSCDKGFATEMLRTRVIISR